MKLTLEQARRLYQDHLEDHFDDDGLLELAEMLGLELTEEDAREAAGLILEALPDAAHLEAFLKAQSGGAWSLLLRLLELGDVHPPGSYTSGLADLDQEDLTAAFLILRSAGLITATMHGSLPCLAIQPYARLLLTEAVESHRRRRYDEAPPEIRPAPSLSTLLALAVNHCRAHTVRWTRGDSVHRRDGERGNRLFEALAGQGDVIPFEFLLRCLVRLGPLRPGADGHLHVAPAGELELLDRDPVELALDLLSTTTDGVPLHLALLDLARGFRDDLPDGWIEDRRLLRTAEMFGVEVRSLLEEPDDPERVARVTRRRADELVWCGLLETCPRGEITWYRISGAGLRVLDRLEGREPTEESAAPAEKGAETGALVQANLEILVPLDAPASTHLEVGTLGRLETVDALCRYRIEKDHVKRVASREGADPSSWRERLERCSAHELPEPVTRTVDDWIQQVATLECERGAVVRLAESDHSDARAQALKNAADSIGATRLAEGIYLIPEGVSAEKAARAFHDEGLRVDLASEPPADSDLTARPDREACERRLSRDLQDLRLYGHTFLDPVPFFTSTQRRAEEEEEVRPAEEAGTPAAGSTGPWVGADSGEIPAFLHQAVRQNWTVELHLDGSYPVSHRMLQPDTVLRRGSRVYLTGVCLESGENRAFPLDSILRARRQDPTTV